MDTVFARSTPPGRAGVAVVRLSGPASWDAVRALTQRALPAPRRLVRRRIHGRDGIIDDAMVVVFAEGASFTGEAAAEFQLHGSEAVVRALLDELALMEGLRHADAGAFTRRAFENDRIGLSEAEGLAALLEAESVAQHRLAMGLYTGGLRHEAERRRSQLTRVLAALEVTIDFADEDVPDTVEASLSGELRGLSARLHRQAEGAGAARKVARGFEVALVGDVNAGKSTLLNRLAGRDAAITSDIAGTTRDIVEVRVELGGHMVTLLDTAGIRATVDPIERLGVARAVARARSADLRLFLSEPPADVPWCEGDIRVCAKADLEPRTPSGSTVGLSVSALTGQGVPELAGQIADRLAALVAPAGLALTDRQEGALRRAAEALDRAADMLETRGGVEMASAEVHAGLAALDGLIGRVGPEDVLGEVFSRFCIGK